MAAIPSCASEQTVREHFFFINFGTGEDLMIPEIIMKCFEKADVSFKGYRMYKKAYDLQMKSTP